MCPARWPLFRPSPFLRYSCWRSCAGGLFLFAESQGSCVGEGLAKLGDPLADLAPAAFELCCCRADHAVRTAVLRDVVQQKSGQRVRTRYHTPDGTRTNADFVKDFTSTSLKVRQRRLQPRGATIVDPMGQNTSARRSGLLDVSQNTSAEPALHSAIRTPQF